MTQIHHVVFHDDIDGIVSAAIYLHNHVKGSTYRLYPTSSSSRGEKLATMIKEMNLDDERDVLVILDFENHSRSNLWVDHHFDVKIGEEEVRNSKVIYDPGSKSAARLVQSIPFKLSAVAKYPIAFLDTVDLIDQANYKTVGQIFNDNSPLMILRAYIERVFPSDMMFSRVVEMIAKTHFDFRKTIYQLKLNENILFSLKKEAEKISKYMIITGNFSTVNQRRINQYPRYSEFFIRPETKYSVRITPTGNGRVYMQIGYNKWSSNPNEINIGKALSKLSYLIRGGGHYGVGGAILNETDVDKLLDDLSIILNREEPLEDMEKVGVDKEVDPIEVQAESMVKTGEEKNISDAREKVLKPKNEEKKEQEDHSAGKTNS